MKQLIKIFSVLFLGLVWTSCGPTTSMTSSWKAQQAQSRDYKKIVVVGLIRESDRTLRERMEQHITGDLKEMGYNAVCSCEEFNPKAFENMSEDAVISKLRDAGVDAVLTVVLLDKEKERYYVPGRVYYSPYAVYHNRYYGYYRTMYTRIYSPGYYVEDTRYFWESNFYDLSLPGDNLIYSAQSRSFDPASSESLSHEYGEMIVKDMVKNNILVSQKTTPLKAM